eukprot:7789602-Alexandrium_andersonii.AAC.1
MALATASAASWRKSQSWRGCTCLRAGTSGLSGGRGAPLRSRHLQAAKCVCCLCVLTIVFLPGAQGSWHRMPARPKYWKAPDRAIQRSRDSYIFCNIGYRASISERWRAIHRP